MKDFKIPPVFRSVKDRWDILALGVIFVVITLSSIPPLASGGKLNFNDDSFQYAARHEAVRKSLLEYHTFPLRSHWFGGGYPTLGDPEDPTLNPLVILSVLFGTVMGLKIIVYLTLLVGGLSAYALARYILRYTRWGALFSGLIFGTSLFVPLRVADGNYNEVYAAFLPLCMLLIGLACRGRKSAVLILPFVFYTMLSDGKLNALMGILCIGILCLFDLIPIFNTLNPKSPSKIRDKVPTYPGECGGVCPRKALAQPAVILIMALLATFLIGMARFLPALELIGDKGGLGRIDLFFHPGAYSPEGVHAYTFEEIWQGTLGWKGSVKLVTVGWVPAALFVIALLAFWKRSLPWAISLILFGWLAIAHNAPVDLLKFLWKLPVFNAIYRPNKYFSFQIVFALAVASGQSFWLLKKLRPEWLEHLCAIVLVIAGVWFLYPRMARIQRDTYSFDTPVEFLTPEGEFCSVQGQDLDRNRKEPLRSNTYLNLIRNVGTIDWYTGIPIAEDAVPRYFVGKKNKYIPNPEYRGEVFFLDMEDVKASEGKVPAYPGEYGVIRPRKARFRPNSIRVQINIKRPGTLVINQNYHRDWHTNRGELFNRDGLIALKLRETGPYTISMRYVPRSFYTGLVISILSLAALVFGFAKFESFWSSFFKACMVSTSVLLRRGRTSNHNNEC